MPFARTSSTQDSQRLGAGEASVTVVLNSSDVGCCKPNPAIFRILLDRVACRGEDVAFIDANPENAQAATSLGLRALHFVSTETVVARLDELLASGGAPTA